MKIGGIPDPQHPIPICCFVARAKPRELGARIPFGSFRVKPLDVARAPWCDMDRTISVVVRIAMCRWGDLAVIYRQVPLIRMDVSPDVQIYFVLSKNVLERSSQVRLRFEPEQV